MGQMVIGIKQEPETLGHMFNHIILICTNINIFGVYSFSEITILNKKLPL